MSDLITCSRWDRFCLCLTRLAHRWGRAVDRWCQPPAEYIGRRHLREIVARERMDGATFEPTVWRLRRGARGSDGQARG